MSSTQRPARTRPSRRAFLIPSLLASALMIANCAVRSSVVTIAAPPRLAVPSLAAETCHLSTLAGEELADLAIAYRSRGLDVRECEGKRALAVQTIETEHRLEDEQIAAREERNRPMWKRLTPWRED